MGLRGYRSTWQGYFVQWSIAGMCNNLVVLSVNIRMLRHKFGLEFRSMSSDFQPRHLDGRAMAYGVKTTEGTAVAKPGNNASLHRCWLVAHAPPPIPFSPPSIPHPTPHIQTHALLHVFHQKPPTTSGARVTDFCTRLKPPPGAI